MALSMSWAVPVKLGRLDERIIKENLASPTYDKETFDREYNSIWSSNIAGAAFGADLLTKVRKMKRYDLRARHDDPDSFYVVSADMAKDGQAKTAVTIIKVKPRDFNFLYQCVNAFIIDSTDYKVISDRLKATVAKYEASLFVYDANGIGAALRDWINRDSVDENGVFLEGLGIINPPKDSEKDVIKYDPSRTICYEIKASGELNGKINKLFFGRINSGAIKLLISTREVLDKLKDDANFMKKSLVERRRFLSPYEYTDKIEEELLNLDVVEVNDTGSTVLKVERRNKAIQKDFFSSLSYGVYATHMHFEVKHYNRKKRNKFSEIFRLS